MAAAMHEGADGFRFGQFEVDRRTGEIRKLGMRLRLRGRPIDLLLVLLARPGELVTRDELRAHLWPADTFVDFDHGLHSAVNRLRETLGDSADNPRFIETLPRKGYRFIAPVSVVTRDAPPAAPGFPVVPGKVSDTASSQGQGALAVEPPPAALEERPASASAPQGAEPAPRSVAPGGSWSRRGAMFALAAVGAVVLLWAVARSPAPARGPITVVVVPFDNLSGDPGQEYFSDGFTEELIAELGMVGPERLAVIGRTTSMLYKGARKSVGEIGRELGANYLLAGSVRRADSRLRITAQLVDTRTMASLWAESFDRDAGDALAIQREVAGRIATALAVALAPVTTRVAERRRPSVAAHELYMRGRAFREQATAEGARHAIELYERALALEPDYAAAHAGIADAYRLLGAPGWEVDRPATLLARAKAAAERALALDAQSPEARAVLAMIRFNFDWDLVGAEREITEALRLNPSLAQAHQYYSSILTCAGRPEEAIAAARRAVELDPMAPTATTSLGVRYYYARQLSEARGAFRKTLDITPGFSVAHWGLAQVHRLEGQLEAQLDELRAAVQLSGNSAYMRAHLAYGYAVAGDRVHAEALARELEDEGRSRYAAPYHLALIAAGLGDTARAVSWLERAHADRSGWMVFLPVEPEFDAMRSDPAFERLLARVTPQTGAR